MQKKSPTCEQCEERTEICVAANSNLTELQVALTDFYKANSTAAKQVIASQLTAIPLKGDCHNDMVGIVDEIKNS